MKIKLFSLFYSLSLVLVLVYATSCNFEKAEKKGQKPNIIFILIDDLGWRDVGYMGSNYYETPNIDKLAGMGMSFTNAYAACAVCSPTRASVMIGKYPARLGITDWIHVLDPEAAETAETGLHLTEYVGDIGQELICPPNKYWLDLEEFTIAEILKDAGYITAHIGKWHLGSEKWWPDKQGFDFNFGGADMGQPPSYFDPYKRNKERPGIPTLKPRKEGEYLTDREADEAVNFISEYKDTTFFLNLWHYAVHTPIQAKEEIIQKYSDKTPDGNQKNPVYAAMIESVDDALGRILGTLEEYNLMENTIIVFFSDNGGLVPVTSNKPLRIGKGYPYEGGIREPMFVYWPGIVNPETVCDIPVTSVDFFPTICSMVGIPVPDIEGLDGKDLTPLLKGKKDINRDAIYWHFPHYRGHIVPYSIIRKDNFKLIKRYEGKAFELFDLDNDISESQDLTDSLPDKVAELDGLLKEWLIKTNAKIPEPNLNYVESKEIEHPGIGQPLMLKISPSDRYGSGNSLVLLDGWLGSGNQTKTWLGFKGSDCTATIDLQALESFTKVSVRFLQKHNAQIFLPEKVSVEVSSDGNNFVLVEEKILDQPFLDDENQVKEIEFSFYPKEHRYMRLTAKNIRKCPDWHRGAGDEAWLFVDEIVIE